LQWLSPASRLFREEFREQARVFFDDPDKARADFRTGAAQWAALGSDPAWWMERWGDRAGTGAAHSQEVADYLALIIRDGYRDDDEGWWED
jgi:hypothetical protein